MRIATIQLLAGLVWMLPIALRPLGIPLWRGGQYSDLLISHWPNAWFTGNALRTWGQLPLWNPMILAGAPFAADPLAGLWYPPNWLVIWFPEGWAFNLLLWLHLAWAGSGMWLLLRRMQLSQAAALVGSLAFSGMPKLVGHIGLGHLGLVSAVCWTPWAVLAAAAAADRDAWPRGEFRRAALAGGVLGLVFLADPRWFLPASLLSLFVAMRQVSHSHYGGGRLTAWFVARGAVAGMVALGLAASLALPLQEFLSLSTRSDLPRAESGALALPAVRLLGLIAPDLGGWPEWQTYSGIIVLALVSVALLGRSRGSLFWAGLALACGLLALGDQTPLHGLLATAVPGYALLRVPSRWLFGVGFSLAVLAALGLDRLVSAPFQGRERARLRLALFGLACLVLTLGVVALQAAGSAASLRTVLPYSFSAAWLAAALSLTHPRLRAALSPRWLAFGWAALLALDLALVDFSEIRSGEAGPTGSGAIAPVSTGVSALNLERAFSPSYSLPQPQAALAGLQLADGINPLQLRSLRDYLAAATGFEAAGYSVTLPPFPDGDPRRPWGVRPDPARLGRLSVTYLVSAYPVEAEGWGFVGVSGGEYVYRNALARPRAWVELDGQDGPWRPAEVLEWSPNRIRVQAEGPGRLVLSEIEYPGWMATLDGAPVTLQGGSNPLRATHVPSGTHLVEFVFWPWRVFAGAAITLITLAALAAMWLLRA